MAKDINLDEYQKAIVCMIVHDVIQAATTFEKQDMKVALDSVKKIKQPDGELDIGIMMALKNDHYMKFVWGTVDDPTHKEKRLALVYEGVAFQID